MKNLLEFSKKIFFVIKIIFCLVYCLIILSLFTACVITAEHPRSQVERILNIFKGSTSKKPEFVKMENSTILNTIGSGKNIVGFKIKNYPEIIINKNFNAYPVGKSWILIDTTGKYETYINLDTSGRYLNKVFYKK